MKKKEKMKHNTPLERKIESLRQRVKAKFGTTDGDEIMEILSQKGKRKRLKPEKKAKMK